MRVSEYADILRQFKMIRLPRYLGCPIQFPIYTYRDYFNQIKINNGKNPCYISQNSFEMLDDKPVKIRVEKVFIDLDCKLNPREAHTEMKTLSDYLYYEWLPYCCTFSGSKGFHVNILLEDKVMELPNVGLSKMYKGIFIHLKKQLHLETIDLRTAESRRLQRIPFTIHSNNNWCIPISMDIMDDFDEIMIQSSEPRCGRNYVCEGKKITINDLIEMWNIDTTNIMHDNDVNIIPYNVPNADIVKYLEELIPQKCIVNRIFQSVPRHDIRFALISWLRFLDFGKEDAMNILRQVAEVAPWNHAAESEIEYQIDNIYRREYFVPSCNSLTEYCVGDKCERYKR